jgi:hypothetical protein
MMSTGFERRFGGDVPDMTRGNHEKPAYSSPFARPATDEEVATLPTIDFLAMDKQAEELLDELRGHGRTIVEHAQGAIEMSNGSFYGGRAADQSCYGQ